MIFINFHAETENLIIKAISDFEFLEEIFKEFTPEITKYMLPKSADDISETREFVETAIQKNRDGVSLMIQILKKDDQSFLGCGGLENIQTKAPELGIWIKKSAHGHHYGREAMQALKNWADANLEYDHLIYPVAEENVASRKIPESMGGVVKKEYSKENMSGNTLHILEYWVYP